MIAREHERGVVLLLSVIIMAAVGLSAFLAVSQLALNTLVTSREETSAWIVRNAVFGCLDETLIQLAGNPAWSAPTVTTNQATCTVAFQTPAPSTTDILVTWTSGDISRGVRARLTLSPLVVSEIEETLVF